MVENAGSLSATDGQVILAAGDDLTLVEATGAADSLVPGVRGLLAVPGAASGAGGPHLAENDVGGEISSERGSIFLGSSGSANSATVNAGALVSSTSVARNGAIEISGTDIDIAPGSLIAITPDDTAGTIPQDPTSLDDFKPSEVTIGNLNARISSPTTANSAALIDIETNALIYAPSGDIDIGSAPGANAFSGTSSTSRVFVDDGATIDASGLKGVLIPASRNEIEISPLKNNELADSPAYKDSFLNGATVFVDPRLSGVRDDGVAWIGSPLIDAKSYQQQVGVTASELMTAGGTVTLGASSYTGAGAATAAPDVVVKTGASIDISGGWVTYQGGSVMTTQLLTSDGRVVDIGSANLTDVYVGIFNGNSVDHAQWGVVENFANVFRTGGKAVPTYNEGRDAGSLTIKSSAIELDGTIYAQAYPGTQQILSGQPGTGTSGIYGDQRPVQAAGSQLPAGGFLFIQSLSLNSSGGASAPYYGGADIVVESAADYQALPADFSYGQAVTTPRTAA